MRKRCELCGGEARVHCESDQASLCWDCDGEVHGANFLVAKHVRVLLCGSCQAPTPWKASGTRIGSAVCVCEGCFGHLHGRVVVMCGEERQGGVDHHERDEDEDVEDDEEEDEEEEDLDEEEEEDGENQVVPWACDSPPPVDGSSSDEFDEVSESRMKWTHQITSTDSEKPECCGSCDTSSRTGWATTSSNLSSRPAKRQRRVDESKQSIERNEQYLGEDKEEGPRMASRMVNLMKTLRHNAVSCEDAMQSRLLNSGFRTTGYRSGF